MELAALEQLLVDKKQSAAAANSPAEQLEAEAARLQQSLLRLRQVAAAGRKSDESAESALKQLQQTALRLTQAIQELEKRNEKCRKEVDALSNEKERMRKSNRQQAGDLTHSLLQQSDQIREQALRAVRLEDEDQDDSAGHDVADQ